MLDRRLIIKYSLLCLAIIFIFVSILINNKNDEISSTLEKNSNIINQNYTFYNNRHKEFSEIIFHKHISNNDELLKILKSKLSNTQKYQKISKLLKNEVSFFKSLDIKSLNIYSQDAIPLFKSSQNFFNSEIRTDYKKFLLENKNRDSSFYTSISSTSASTKFLRVIYDEEYNTIGFFEVVFDMPKFAHKIHLEKNMKVNFIYKKELLKKTLNKNLFQKYKEYELNQDYMYEKSFFNIREKTIPLSVNIEKEIKNRMNGNTRFSKVIKSNNEFFIKTFIPMFDEVTKEKNGYIVITNRDKEFLLLVNRYDLYILITIVLAVICIMLIYIINMMQIRYKIVNSELKSINKSIDKYVIVAETDLDGIITYISQAFCNISGYKKAEIVGRPINMIRSPDISKKFFENMWKKLKREEVWEGEIKNIDKNGNSYWVKGNIVPIYNHDEKVVGYRSIRVNISDEKQLLKMNDLLKRDLFSKLNEIKTRDKLHLDESKVKLMSQILDAFSNEWKKPISNISSKIIDFENRAKNNNYTQEYISEFISEIHKEVKFLSINLNEFKTLFSTDDKNDRYNVYSVIKTAISSIYEKDISISLSGDENLETFGVSYDLRKIVLGIINNSIEEFRIKNIKEAKININISKTNDYLLIKCEDNAGGIPEEILSKVFDPDFSTKDVTSSNGIPMHIAKLIIKKSDGDIWVKNQNGGCCFYIKLITRDRRITRRASI